MAVCNKKAITISDDMFHLNAVINNDLCINCGICQKVCLQQNNVEQNKPIKWYQGWCSIEKVRRFSASGGIAWAIGKKFIEDGGVVCSCSFSDGAFKFEICDNIEELQKFSGSKYVKSNPVGIHREINKKLKAGVPVLFVGLPCQAEGVRRSIPEKYRDKLMTVDLICHGTPSRLFLKKYLSEHEIILEKLKHLSFRSKNGFALNEGKMIGHPGVMDRYSIAFLNSLSYTENCYKCKFACKCRSSDITIGDSWGTDLVCEAGKGVSLILCQSEKGCNLIENSQIELHDVDLKRAITNNPQLSRASLQPKNWDAFVKEINDGKNIDKTVFKYLKYRCLKQIVKKQLLRLHLLRK